MDESSTDQGARSLVAAALRPAVRALCELRLVVLLLLAANELVIGSFVETSLLLVAVIPNAYLLLMPRNFTGESGRRSARFVLGDGTASSVVLLIAISGPMQLHPLGVGYVLFSALLIGVILEALPLLLWWLVACAPATIAVLVVDIPGTSIIVGSLCAVGVASLGGRMRRQMERVEGLILDLARTRAANAAAHERLVIARDLHDTMAKSAAGVRMLAEALQADLARVRAPQASMAEALFQAADANSREARAVLDELRTTASQDVREQLAIDVRRWSERTGTRAQIEAAGAAVRADSGAAWQLQRVVGELLTNVERHAQASEVIVRLLGMDDRLHLVVEDDGRGLPEDVLAAPTARVEAGHYGLGGLVERVGALEGSFHAGKREGGGARAEIVIPFGQHVGRTVEV